MRCQVDTRKGITEEYFLSILNDWFSEKIFTGYILEEDLSGNPYAPDFIFQDQGTNLHIDIEIDEPYTTEFREGIHCTDDDGFDSARDDYFNAYGWIVIRFAEEQIVTQPFECCKRIAEEAKNWAKLDCGRNFEGMSNVTKIACWNFQDARKLANHKSRENYLSKYDLSHDKTLNNTAIELHRSTMHRRVINPRSRVLATLQAIPPKEKK